MDREKLNRHKKNKREMALIETQIEKLYDRLEDVEIVSGKVTKSGDEFPYIEEHMTVQMPEPRAASALKERIREKEVRLGKIQAEIDDVEDFISGLPDGIEKQVLEMVYLENMSQRDAADQIGYTQARVSQIIREVAKDL